MQQAQAVIHKYKHNMNREKREKKTHTALWHHGSRLPSTVYPIQKQISNARFLLCLFSLISVALILFKWFINAGKCIYLHE